LCGRLTDNRADRRAFVQRKEIDVRGGNGALTGLLEERVVARQDGNADLLQDRFDLAFENPYLFLEGCDSGL
jgi:hypothetical protein